MRCDRPWLATRRLDRWKLGGHRLGMTLGEQLRREALRFTDALHLDRDRLDRLLHPLQPRAVLEVDRRAAPATAQDAPRQRVDDREQQDEAGGLQPEALRLVERVRRRGR